MPEQQMEPGDFSRLSLPFTVVPSVPDRVMLEHVRSAVTRGLPQAGRFKAHDRVISIAGGGPSLEDTWNDLTGDVAAINASLGYLMERGVKPAFCGVLDPGEHIADLIECVDGVWYFVSSTCHPSVFEKLKNNDVVLWHPSGMEGIEEIDGVDFLVGGGSTMGMRWVTLAYLMGYRKMHLHGLDSSYKRTGETHAYPDRRDGNGEVIEVGGYPTAMNFVGQVNDFLLTVHRFQQSDIEPVAFHVHGDGLLQSKWRELTGA